MKYHLKNLSNGNDQTLKKWDLFVSMIARGFHYWVVVDTVKVINSSCISMYMYSTYHTGQHSQYSVSD